MTRRTDVRLAAELGFADQAHLSRTVRVHLRHTPTALRAALHEAPPQPGERSSHQSIGKLVRWKKSGRGRCCT